MKLKNPILLAILDGYGIAPKSKGNAIADAYTPNMDYFTKEYPNTLVNASGKYVGLPDGQMGNSEVGHLNIGAGFVVRQGLTLIDDAIKDKSFFENKEFLAAIENASKNKSKMHIIGLLSDGGVHSHISHILALLDLMKIKNFKNVYVHVITDGRDTAPEVAINYINQLLNKFKEVGFGTIATIGGRYYGMDRDKRWDREQIAYDVIVSAKGQSFSDPIKYVESEYREGHSDEFIIPAYNAVKTGTISDYDSVIFANFRPDRIIQIASGLTNQNYIWHPKPFIENLFTVIMMPYADSVKTTHIAYKPVEVVNGFGSWVSKKGYSQLRIAETEKYAHVTYFFDGGKDIVYRNEDRILVPSPKVATYDLKPEMSAYEVAANVIEQIALNKYDFIILNFANSDMVGHTGVLDATIKAIEAIDVCLGQIYDILVKKHNGIMIITADHGNGEKELNADGTICKKHTSNPVPVIITKQGLKLKSNMSIGSISPTILDLAGIQKPDDMKCDSLLIRDLDS